MATAVKANSHACADPSRQTVEYGLILVVRQGHLRECLEKELHPKENVRAAGHGFSPCSFPTGFTSHLRCFMCLRADGWLSPAAGMSSCEIHCMNCRTLCTFDWETKSKAGGADERMNGAEGWKDWWRWQTGLAVVMADRECGQGGG